MKKSSAYCVLRGAYSFASVRVLTVAFVLLWLVPDVLALLARRPDEAWARVRTSGVVRFASDASYHPFEGVGGDGEFYGLDIDIAREVARRIGARAEFANVGIDGLFDVLRVGQADASISALPIDATRLRDWAYSRPYFDAGLVLVMRVDADPFGKDELPGHTIAVALGSDGDARLRYYQRRVSGIEGARFGSSADALQAVKRGSVDAALVDGVSARQLLVRFDGLRIAARLTHEPFAIALWGESVELRAAIDRALDEMLADGTIERIVEEWMRK